MAGSVGMAVSLPMHANVPRGTFHRPTPRAFGATAHRLIGWKYDNDTNTSTTLHRLHGTGNGNGSCLGGQRFHHCKGTRGLAGLGRQPRRQPREPLQKGNESLPSLLAVIWSKPPARDTMTPPSLGVLAGGLGGRTHPATTTTPLYSPIQKSGQPKNGSLIALFHRMFHVEQFVGEYDDE